MATSENYGYYNKYLNCTLDCYEYAWKEVYNGFNFSNYNLTINNTNNATIISNDITKEQFL